MPCKVDPNKKNLSPVMILGKDEEGKPVGIDEKSLLQNGLMIIGAKNAGKSEIIPQIVFQQLFVPYTTVDGKEKTPFSAACSSIITAKPDQSYFLLAMARKWKRYLNCFLSPSSDIKVRNRLLGMERFNYENINDILNYVKVFRDKTAVFIDMENDRYEEASVRAVGMLLLHLQITMHNTAETLKRRHYLVVDDAWQYLPYMNSILRYGPEYNVSSVLVFDSRSQYSEHETLVENNIQNILLMGTLRYEDAVYFSKRFNIPLAELTKGGRDHAFLASYDENMVFSVKKCILNREFFTEDDLRLIEAGAKKAKNEMLKASADEEYIKDVMTAYANCVVEQTNSFKIGTTFDSMQKIAKRMDEEEQKKRTAAKQNAPENPVVRTESENPDQEKKNAAEEPDRPAEETAGEKDDTQVTLIKKVMTAPVTEQDRTTPVKRKAQSGDGLRQLIDIADEAPERIKKKLKKEGFPISSAAKDSTEQNPAAKKFDPMEGMGTGRSEILTERGGLPAYGSSTSGDQRKPADTQNRNQQNGQTATAAPKKSKKKKNRKKKTHAENHNQHPSANGRQSQPDRNRSTGEKREEEAARQNSHREEPVKQTLSTAVRPPEETKAEKCEAVSADDFMNSFPDIPEETESSDPEVPDDAYTDESSDDFLDTYDESVMREFTEGTDDNKSSEQLEEDAEHVNEVSENADSGNDFSDQECNDITCSENVPDMDTDKIDDTPLYSMDEVTGETSLFDDDDDETLDIFGDTGSSVATSALSEKTSSQDVRETPRKSTLNSVFANLSVTPRSSGENFDNDAVESNDLIDKLAQKGKNVNFFSRKKEVSFMENK